MVFISFTSGAPFQNELGKRSMRGGNAAHQPRRWLIQSTSLPLNKIALSVGYSDPVYFTRLFRKHNGIRRANIANAMRK